MDATLLLSASDATLAARRHPSTPARRPGLVAPGRRPASCRSVRARAAAAAAPAAGGVAGVGLVSDYDLLALDSMSGNGLADTNKNMFPDVDSTWKTFHEIQRLLSKTNGKVIANVMTSSPLAVRENSNLDAATRLLLETKYRRLPVVDSAGKQVDPSLQFLFLFLCFRSIPLTKHFEHSCV